MTQPGYAYDAAAAPLLGELLMRDFGVSADAIERGLAKQREDAGGLLGQILVNLKVIDEDQLAAALGLQAEMPAVRDLPKADDIPAELFEAVPINFAKQHRVLPIAKDAATGRVQVAICDPFALDVLDDIAVLLGGPVEPVVASPTRIVDHINKAYGRLRQGAELDHDHKKDEGEDEFGQGEELVDILDLNDEAPIIRWVNSLMFQAVKERASDIHIEPGEKDVVVRFRIDGALREVKRAPRKFLASILARVKIMAGLNIAEKRLPQDGRIRRKIAGKEVDMRVATVPTAHGERVTIRLLDKSAVALKLDNIGIAADHLRQIRDVINRPHGIFLVTGPTGSGKTTTLYSALSEINTPDLNIMTVEDPVEYQLAGISQVQVQSKINLTFAAGLRSFLRHDPDVIMVGEIRDIETAEIAIQASLTGHLVLSTIHTNDSATGITRLVDMGVQPFLVASSLVALQAQRLIRRVCLHCCEPYRPLATELEEIGIIPEAFYAGEQALRVPVRGPDGEVVPLSAPEPRRLPPRGHVFKAAGCDKCQGSGYAGRTGVYEVLTVTEEIRRLAIRNADAMQIKQAALAQGLRTLRDDGAHKVLCGLSTLDEVMRATAVEA